jgi:V-ATPase subunit C
MRYVDGDLKKVMDELNDVKNNLGQLSKGKDSPSFLQKDLGDIIYNSNLNADIYFVEKHGSEILATCIAIVHKTKAEIFLSTYETLIEEAVIPRSAKILDG